VQAVLTFLVERREVERERLGLFGTSYGGATAVWVAAIDPRVKCVVSVVGIGNGARWMRSVRRPDEYHDLMQRSAADRVRRVLTGKSQFVDRNEVLLPDRESAQLSGWQTRTARRSIVCSATGHPSQLRLNAACFVRDCGTRIVSSECSTIRRKITIAVVIVTNEFPRVVM